MPGNENTKSGILQGSFICRTSELNPRHNNQVSTAKNKKNGVHTLGQASDILISWERAMLLFKKTRQLGFSGIDLLQREDY